MHGTRFRARPGKRAHFLKFLRNPCHDPHIGNRQGGCMSTSTSKREFLLLSDFDQTLSFNDSGLVLAEMMGIPNFDEYVRKLASTHLVQQGGELAYLLIHEPAFKDVRKQHLREAGKKVRLKKHIKLLAHLLENIGGCHFSFYVVSAAPQQI